MLTFTTKQYLSNLFIFFSFIIFSSQSIAAADKNSYLTLAIGHVAIFDDDIDHPGSARIEYRMPTTSFWGLAPGVGYGRTEGGADFIFAYAEKDFDIAENWVMSGSFGVGSFDDGQDVKLGKEIEFRSGVRLAYRFENDMRLGVELFHLSNGGLGDRNPGTEPAFISLFIPF